MSRDVSRRQKSFRNRFSIRSFSFVSFLTNFFEIFIAPCKSLEMSAIPNENEGFSIFRHFLRSELKFTNLLEQLIFCFDLFIFSRYQGIFFMTFSNFRRLSYTYIGSLVLSIFYNIFYNILNNYFFTMYLHF